ncbi:hypothetical protein LXA43DRAFT_388720 [Ganoderma leucocontextum]|nr:hypothetical protein LXA43DRAFT_388720 [Ganoderma leucocontextum]
MKNVTGSPDEPVKLPEELGAAALLELLVVASVTETVVVVSLVKLVVTASVVSSESQSASESVAVVEEWVVVDAPVVLDDGLVGIEVMEVVVALERSVETDVVFELAATTSIRRFVAELVEVGTEVDDVVVVVLFAAVAALSVVVEGDEVVVRLGSVETVELVVELVIIQRSVVVEVLVGPVTLVEELPVGDKLSKITWATSEPFMTHGTRTSTRP